MSFSWTPSESVLGLRAGLEEISLAAVTELVHTSQQTGILYVHASLDGGDLPLELVFRGGEVVGASILDWEGLDALYSFPQMISNGWCEFWQTPAAPYPSRPALAPFAGLMGEWARLSDEWPRFCQQIFSPSKRFAGELEPFARPGGASAHWAAAASGQPLHEVCAQMAALRQAGFIQPVAQSFEWDTLVLPTALLSAQLRPGPVLRLVDGQRPISALMERGLSADSIRSELLETLDPGSPFPGSGRARRDWLWEYASLQTELLLT